jgi:hypothetical protein
MIEKISLSHQKIFENNIEQILERAVELFKKTGLTDLADKWERILKTYTNKKYLT